MSGECCADAHKNHMCEMVKEERMGEVKAAAKNAQYVCAQCGRAAASEEHLCKPESA